MVGIYNTRTRKNILYYSKLLYLNIDKSFLIKYLTFIIHHVKIYTSKKI